MKDTTIAIDKAGRLVLPKAVREQFRLRPGSRLRLETRGDHLRLSPVEAEPALVQVDGWWVHRGSLGPDEDLTEAVARFRNERLDDLAR